MAASTNLKENERKAVASVAWPGLGCGRWRSWHRHQCNGVWRRLKLAAQLICSYQLASPAGSLLALMRGSRLAIWRRVNGVHAMA
jgi:hypothetical protein